MVISLPKSQKGLRTVEAINIYIRIGEAMLCAVEVAYAAYPQLLQRERREVIKTVIRKINGKLGVEGNFKNGCLYREQCLPEKWKRSDGIQVCDHAISAVKLAEKYLQAPERENLVALALSPVVRLSNESNTRLTKAGLADDGGEPGHPLFRYSRIDPEIKIVTHEGSLVNTATWTDDNHWKLVARTAKETPDLKEIIDHFKIKLGRD